MFISASVIENPDDPDCTTYEEVCLIVIDPRPDVPNQERCRLALEALFARDERVKRGQFAAITLAHFVSPSPQDMDRLRAGIPPDHAWLVLTPADVLEILSSS